MSICFNTEKNRDNDLPVGTLSLATEGKQVNKEILIFLWACVLLQRRMETMIYQ